MMWALWIYPLLKQEFIMTHLLPKIFTGLALATVLAPSIAFADVALGDMVGTTDVEIQNKLEMAGYSIDEIEREDGKIEVDAKSGDQEFEIVIAADSGKVIKIELED